jgi:uncharacterized LabA/DUF88 family protein
MVTYTMGGSVDPHLRRWMLFVDGENLTFRAQELAGAMSLTFNEGAYYERDSFIWLPDVKATNAVIYSGVQPRIQLDAVRAHYYCTVKGDDARIELVREKLWSLGFHPEVFKKTRQDQKAKGVDIALCRDMLTHAFFNNYEVAVLVSGDGDYIPLVEELKHLGKVVCLAFFSNSGLNRRLKIKSDMFADIGSSFFQRWKGHTGTR